MNPLEGTVQHYAWGSTTAVARLLGREPSGHPEAELWLGAHPSAPSCLLTADGAVPLDAAIAQDPKRMLGERVRNLFGDRLPYLLKVLAAEQPLSIQAHPSADQAAAGHAAENAAGVPADAPHRCYRDAHHKPEVIYAAEPFEALAGLRPADEVLQVLSGVDSTSLGPLREALAGSSGARDAVRMLMSLPQQDVSRLVDDVARACRARVSAGSHSWEHSNAVRLAEAYPGDRGVLLALLMHHVSLKPGEALFMRPGMLHCHLRGVGVEIMAASDNVIRGGLTPKHVDVEELLRIAELEPCQVPFVPAQRPSSSVEVFAPGVPEFALTRVQVQSGRPVTLPDNGPRIVLCLDGDTQLRVDGQTLPLGRGGSVFVPDSDGPLTVEGAGVVFVASVPA